MGNLMDRLKEPSSWVAFAVASGMILPGMENWVGWAWMAESFTAGSAFMAVLMREGR